MKVDAGGKTLAAWLEELEKDKLDRLQKVIDQRIVRFVKHLIVENNALNQYQELQLSITVLSSSMMLITRHAITCSRMSRHFSQPSKLISAP